jgi:hypothetical protein
MTADVDSWIALSTPTLRSRLAHSGAVVFGSGFFLLLATDVALILLPHLSLLDRIFATVGLVMAFGIAAGVVHLLRHPVPSVNFARKELRVGRRIVAFADIRFADRTVEGGMKAPTLVLHLKAEHGPRVPIFLRFKSGPALSESETERLVRVLQASNIAMPTDPYDPTGRFARYNFPTSYDREGAIELVHNPPDPADILLETQGKLNQR